MNQAIHNILQTQGWYEIEKLFKKQIAKSYNVPKEADNETVAREARVRDEVTSELKALLKKIKLSGKEEEVKKPKRLV